jgi:hypothetical protein
MQKGTPVIMWDDLTLRDKVHLFNQWSLVSIFGSIIQLFGSIHNLSINYQILDRQDGEGSNYLIGFGCMFAWFGLIRYFETSKEYSRLANSLAVSAPALGRILMSALPIFMGYACLGTAIFW